MWPIILQHHITLSLLFNKINVMFIFQQANGLNEQFIQTLQMILVKYANECWEGYLECC